MSLKAPPCVVRSLKCPPCIARLLVALSWIFRSLGTPPIMPRWVISIPLPTHTHTHDLYRSLLFTNDTIKSLDVALSSLKTSYSVCWKMEGLAEPPVAIYYHLRPGDNREGGGDRQKGGWGRKKVLGGRVREGEWGCKATEWHVQQPRPRGSSVSTAVGGSFLTSRCHQHQVVLFLPMMSSGLHSGCSCCFLINIWSKFMTIFTLLSILLIFLRLFFCIWRSCYMSLKSCF